MPTSRRKFIQRFGSSVLATSFIKNHLSQAQFIFSPAFWNSTASGPYTKGTATLLN